MRFKISFKSKKRSGNSYVVASNKDSALKLAKTEIISDPSEKMLFKTKLLSKRAVLR